MIGWLIRIISSLSGGKPQEPSQPSSETLVRPRFKDFRHSGGTYEESMANYHAALKEYNRRTGREWTD